MKRRKTPCSPFDTTAQKSSGTFNNFWNKSTKGRGTEKEDTAPPMFPVLPDFCPHFGPLPPTAEAPPSSASLARVWAVWGEEKYL